MVIFHLCISFFVLFQAPWRYPFHLYVLLTVHLGHKRCSHINSFSVFIYDELKCEIIDTKYDGSCATKREAISSFTLNSLTWILFCLPLVWLKLLLGVHSVKAFLDLLFPSVATGKPTFSSLKHCVQTSWVKFMTLRYNCWFSDPLSSQGIVAFWVLALGLLHLSIPITWLQCIVVQKGFTNRRITLVVKERYYRCINVCWHLVLGAGQPDLWWQVGTCEQNPSVKLSNVWTNECLGPENN